MMDLSANKRPQKNITYNHRDSMTDPAQSAKSVKILHTWDSESLNG